ncbi:MAG: hypothetical protein AMXMBFR7_50710 [Planctomycetota bacterium]
MCYAVYISTDSATDLSGRNTDLLRFKRVDDSSADPCIALLDFPNQWYVGSKATCSCTFRHLHTSAVELGFGAPEDWCPEGQDEIDATKELFSVLSEIVSSGYSLDLVDRWEGSQPGDIKIVNVYIGEISRESFRMFEDHKFRFKKEKAQP